MSKRRDPEWRNLAAAGLLIRHLPHLGLSGPVLVMEDPLTELLEALTSVGLEVTAWNRRALGGRVGHSWPPPGPFMTTALRLPRGKDELHMNLHAAASVLQPGGTLLVYGAKDEGIQGVADALEEGFPGAATVAIGGRCRVLKGIRGPGVQGLKSSLAEWKSTVAVDLPEFPSDWISYPGVFAHGRLDEGTRLLLEALPPLPPGSRVLDFGCGSGFVGFVARGRGKDVVVELLDVDAVALEAAGENLPGCSLHLSDGLPSVGLGPFDAILSNPPFHRGKAEDPWMIVSLIEGAPALLRPRGMLVFVAQRRLPVEGALHKHFGDVTVLSEDSTFRVWMGQRPRK